MSSTSPRRTRRRSGRCWHHGSTAVPGGLRAVPASRSASACARGELRRAPAGRRRRPSSSPCGAASGTTPAYFPTWSGGARGAAPPGWRAGASAATEALASFRRYLLDEYAPGAEGTPDAVGPERYRRWARCCNGTDLDLTDAYAYGWDEFKRLDAEMRAEAERVLPGADAARGDAATSTSTARRSRATRCCGSGCRA